MKYKQYFLFLIILLNSSVFFLYAFLKLAGIQLSGHFANEDNLLYKDVSQTQLMLDFFSLKKGYIILIALGQIIAALSILFKRTRFLGTILYLFIATNILAVDIFFEMGIYPLLIIGICFINCLFILSFEKNKLKATLEK